MVGDHLVQPIIACIGFPIAGNPTQFVTERTLKTLGLDWCVVTTAVPSDLLEQALLGAKAMRFAALALLPPHQNEICNLLDQLTEAAQLSRQVQAAKRIEEVWVGHDLRGEAMVQALRDHSITPDRHLLVVGSPEMGSMIPLVDAVWNEHIHTPTSLEELKSRLELSSDGDVSEPIPEHGSAESTAMMPTISALAVSLSCSPEFDKELEQYSLATNGLLISFGDLSQHAGWKEWATKRGWSYLSPFDFQAILLAKMFVFWTQTEPPIALVREWMDEYYEF